jgi:hypothetical protein
MFLRKVVSISIVCSSFFFSAMGSFTDVVFAQDLTKTVFPITQLKLVGPAVEFKFATGFCININRISLHLELPGKWRDYQSVVTYGWLRRAGDPDRLIPTTIFTQIGNGKNVYWCRGLFTNYRIFDSQARIVTGYNAQDLPQ